MGYTLSQICAKKLIFPSHGNHFIFYLCWGGKKSSQDHLSSSTKISIKTASLPTLLPIRHFQPPTAPLITEFSPSEQGGDTMTAHLPFWLELTTPFIA